MKRRPPVPGLLSKRALDRLGFSCQPISPPARLKPAPLFAPEGGPLQRILIRAVRAGGPERL